MSQNFIPTIPASVKARFSGYHITLSGPNEDADLAANMLLNYGFATVEESCEEITDKEKRYTLTFYRKNLEGVIKSISEMGYAPSSAKPSVRRKHDERKASAILNFQVEQEQYAQSRRPLILQALSVVREDIGERAEVIEGRVGRGLDELLAA